MMRWERGIKKLLIFNFILKLTSNQKWKKKSKLMAERIKAMPIFYLSLKKIRKQQWIYKYILTTSNRQQNNSFFNNFRVRKISTHFSSPSITSSSHFLCSVLTYTNKLKYQEWMMLYRQHQKPRHTRNYNFFNTIFTTKTDSPYKLLLKTCCMISIKHNNNNCCVIFSFFHKQHKSKWRIIVCRS